MQTNRSCWPTKSKCSSCLVNNNDVVLSQRVSDKESSYKHQQLDQEGCTGDVRLIFWNCRNWNLATATQSMIHDSDSSSAIRDFKRQCGRCSGHSVLYVEGRARNQDRCMCFILVPNEGHLALCRAQSPEHTFSRNPSGTFFHVHFAAHCTSCFPIHYQDTSTFMNISGLWTHLWTKHIPS